MVEKLRDFLGSLRFRLSFFAGLIVFVAVVIFAVHSVSVQENNLLQARIQEATKDSAVIKAAIWNGMMTKDRKIIRQIVDAIGKEQQFNEINIYDREGVLHYTSDDRLRSQIGRDEKATANPLLTDVSNDPTVRYQFSNDGLTLNLINPLLNDENCSSCHAHPRSQNVLGALEITLPLGRLHGQIRDSALKTYLFGAGLFILVSTMIGLGVIFFVSKRLHHLQKNAARIARGDHELADPMRGTDSIAKLDRAFHDMSRQILERQTQVEQNRRLFKELFEKVPCYIAVIDPDFKIVRANAAYYGEFGDLVGQYCYQGQKGSRSICDNCTVQKTFSDGLPHRSEETWISSRSGKKTHVIVHTSPIFDDSGKVAEVMEMSVDVTPMVRLQSEVEKQRQEFKDLFDNVPCYLLVIDKEFRIGFFNNLVSRDFGDIWGKHCYEVLKGRNEKCDQCSVEKTFLTQKSQSSDEIWKQDHHDICVITNTSLISDIEGKPIAVLQMCTDVTELKFLQSELAVLGETIAGMSHSVKNILAGLEGGVYVVDSGLKSGKEDKIRVGWEMVKKNVAKVSELVRDILYASKERRPEYVRCDPSSILNEIYELFSQKAQEFDISLTKNYPECLGEFSIDPKGIHTVLSNLMSNSIEACRSAGHGGDRRIELSACLKNDQLVIRVSDNGIGMPEEVRKNLFTKFYSTKGSKGTGLGLVVSRKIIEEHGGIVEVSSEPGKGTQFCIKLPAANTGHP